MQPNTKKKTPKIPGQPGQKEFAHNRAFRRKAAKLARSEDQRKLERQAQAVDQAKRDGKAKRKPENLNRKSRDLEAQNATKKRRAARAIRRQTSTK